MFVHTLLAAALVASSSLVAALPTNVQQAVAAPIAASSDLIYTLISPDGSCGGQTGFTCEGSAFGNCCSTSGFCGSTSAFCGINCFSAAGLCDYDSKPVSKAKPILAAEDAPAMAPSPVVTPPQAVHTPWKPTPFHNHYYKPSYIIDNGERAPNQVWN
ncbi:hypothetical protein BDV97DRAFT_75320 [Delphinella strobiligena]|nr:hypothetical protein BDV97DRAFT_75320 [Delphinella strobiligena]